MRDTPGEHGAKSGTRSELQRLGDEVSRIALKLANLSSSADADVLELPQGAKGVPRASLKTVQSIIQGRRLRANYFPEVSFADPAWDMMLSLLRAEIRQQRVFISDLCLASGVPPTTALRWLSTCVDKKVFVRRKDPHDARRVFIELSPETSEALHRFFAEAVSTTLY